jgi:hypothetical protein
MLSVADDFEFIARRANEIRAARCQDLGISTPDAQDPPRLVGQPDGAPRHPGSQPPVTPENQVGPPTYSDDWGCCLRASRRYLDAACSTNA